ncbi:hypothetical protein Bcav_3893 [Beutenbergia cavernae DSM 12333]|uniref:Uncharacterized protein n=1 Tax=Beutenbergia cavernae (strain ATCC BAA-8 / DSM 12333 / CCUG 43141 / JCM 11478 / NBRC 16432 / NCIMB 13614 / HKI 0122) TaxID=471853 RepID=C5C4L1_BEUC1|nr:hypothetical protein [Beutenbergia cavernae]ACQ82135.1 hypothetical protein Bcav_3893 [Beutenbergia cavernae DSM 12333]
MSTVASPRRTVVTPGRRRRVVQAVQVGLVMQLICLALPLLDLWVFGSVERHVRAAYPDWPSADVMADRNAILGGLVAVSLLGLLGWCGAWWSARSGRGVRAVATTLFAVGVTVLLSVAGLSGGAYDQVVPLWLGITSLVLPALPGLTAVLAAWSRSTR